MPTASEKGIAAIGSMTATIKAQQMLSMAGIKADVIALSPGETKRGCAYGLEYPLSAESQIRAALRNARISVSQYLHKGGQDLDLSG